MKFVAHVVGITTSALFPQLVTFAVKLLGTQNTIYFEAGSSQVQSGSKL